MLVVERMTTDPVTITGQATVEEALDTISKHMLHHLPIVDEHDQLVGIVSEKDLLRSKPEKQVAEVMTRDVVTVTEYTALEDAARVMADRTISSLPVMRNGKLVGIITETDLFRVFLELLVTHSAQNMHNTFSYSGCCRFWILGSQEFC